MKIQMIRTQAEEQFIKIQIISWAINQSLAVAWLLFAQIQSSNWIRGTRLIVSAHVELLQTISLIIFQILSLISII